jgi:hypothetical protein
MGFQSSLNALSRVLGETLANRMTVSQCGAGGVCAFLGRREPPTVLAPLRELYDRESVWASLTRPSGCAYLSCLCIKSPLPMAFDLAGPPDSPFVLPGESNDRESVHSIRLALETRASGTCPQCIESLLNRIDSMIVRLSPRVDAATRTTETPRSRPMHSHVPRSADKALLDNLKTLRGHGRAWVMH